MDNKALKSKAIKNITRSSTTFTATRCNGTTFTFNQQDNNTTYNVATTSANGLMSAADKTKVDKIKGFATTIKEISFNGWSNSNTAMDGGIEFNFWMTNNRKITLSINQTNIIIFFYNSSGTEIGRKVLV